MELWKRSRSERERECEDVDVFPSAELRHLTPSMLEGKNIDIANTNLRMVLGFN